MRLARAGPRSARCRQWNGGLPGQRAGTQDSRGDREHPTLTDDAAPPPVPSARRGAFAFADELSYAARLLTTALVTHQLS